MVLVYKIIQRIRTIEQKPSANQINTDDLVISGEYTMTSKGDKFLFYDNKMQKRVLIFLTLENLNTLKECSNWIGDVIFCSVPTLFSQLNSLYYTRCKK